MDEIAATCDTLVVTKNGKPVAELIPPAERQRPWSGAPLHAHRDPADRFLMAQAQLADATPLTADRAILASRGPPSRQHAGL